jgi:hypothetical protein
VALALAERHSADVAGLVLLSGYYFPTPRLDALLVAPAAVPVLGDILRHTISPVFGWLNMPLMKRIMFAPAPLTERFKREYSTALALRPSQLRATAADGALMMSDAKALSARYGELAMPVAIVAGSGDKVVSPDHAERLRGAVPDATLRTVEGAGHMVHNVANPVCGFPGLWRWPAAVWVYRTRMSGQWVALCGAPEGLLLPDAAHVGWAAMAVLLDQPLGVVAGDEGPDGVAHLLDGLEEATMDDLFFQGAE